MGREDVGRALQAMNEPAVCERLAAGDFSAVPGLALDEREQSLVRDAAAEYPEVTGLALTGEHFKTATIDLGSSGSWGRLKTEYLTVWTALAYVADYPTDQRG